MQKTVSPAARLPRVRCKFLVGRFRYALQVMSKTIGFFHAGIIKRVISIH